MVAAVAGSRGTDGDGSLTGGGSRGFTLFGGQSVWEGRDGGSADWEERATARRGEARATARGGGRDEREEGMVLLCGDPPIICGLAC